MPFVWIGAGVLALTLAVAGATSRFMRPAPASGPSDAGNAHQAARARTPEVSSHVEVSRRAWLDANVDRAREEARAALRSNENDAAAHLAIVVATPFWPDNEARSHFVHAQEGRDRLSQLESAYLEAVAPAMTVPPNFRLSAERLATLHQNAPDDLPIHLGLAEMLMRTEEIEKAHDLLAPLGKDANAPAVVLSELGTAQSFRDDVESARATFSRCLEGYPAATGCATLLAQLEQNEGRCAGAERVLRRSLSLFPNSAGTYLSLAYDLQGMAVSPSEIRPVLERWARFSDGAAMERNLVRTEIRMALLEGRLREAVKLDAKLGKLMADVDDDEEQFDYTLYSMLLKAEVGQRADATKALDAYIARRHGLMRSSYGGDNVLYLVSVGARLGLVPWPKWLEQRNARLAVVTDRDGMLDSHSRKWLEYFAMPAATEASAKEALDVLPQYLPILHRIGRWFWHDGAIGRVYMLMGRHVEARPYFERAAASCNALEDLVQHTHALLDFASLLERTGDSKRACEMYDRVLGRWPAHSGSVSAARASQRRRSLCGPLLPDH
ncbi:tetratricopeptide repeat protein [Pendulispora albinea]|uniref:Tetratricopeptide repeat protein n=1 Tax=Pendulispora albinea TaxID=2741071 RepID=A0ABZ2LSD4_9BACT